MRSEPVEGPVLSRSKDLAKLELVPVDGGTRVRLRVKPGARRSAIVGVHGGALKLAVGAPPERGKANDAVVALLAEVLGLPAASVTIVAGATSPDKVVVAALAPSLVLARLSGHTANS